MMMVGGIGKNNNNAFPLYLLLLLLFCMVYSSNFITQSKSYYNYLFIVYCLFVVGVKHVILHQYNTQRQVVSSLHILTANHLIAFLIVSS